MMDQQEMEAERAAAREEQLEERLKAQVVRLLQARPDQWVACYQPRANSLSNSQVVRLDQVAFFVVLQSIDVDGNKVQKVLPVPVYAVNSEADTGGTGLAFEIWDADYQLLHGSLADVEALAKPHMAACECGAVWEPLNRTSWLSWGWCREHQNGCKVGVADGAL